MGLELPGLKLAHELYSSVQNAGGGKLGTQALQKSLAQLSGVDWDSR
jgi:3-hydroxyisobutyrate dehydrogenase